VTTAFPLIPRRRVLGLPFGGLHSLRRGLGSDIAGSRPYEPGDDVDKIDWYASARLSLARGSEEFIVREHYADEAPRVVVLCDRRPSMSVFQNGWPWLRKPQAIRHAVKLIGDSAAAARGLLGYLDEAEGTPHWRPPRGEAYVGLLEGDRPFRAPEDTLTRGLVHLAQQRRDLPAQVFHGHWERDPATVPVVDGLQAGLHDPNRFHVRVTDPLRATVALHPLVWGTDQPSQGNLAGYPRGRHGDQELSAIQPTPPQFGQHLHGLVEVICPQEADLGLLQAHHAAAGGAVVDEVVPRDAGDALDADGVVAADAAFAGFPFADVAAADAEVAASAVPVLPVLDVVGEVVLGPASGEPGRPEFLAPGGDEGHDQGPRAGGLAALYLLPQLMEAVSLISC